MADESEYLKFWIIPEDDESVEVHIAVSASGFGGTGAAGFARKAIEDFAAQLEEFQDTLTGEPELSGGFWESKYDPEDEEFISLHFFPESASGPICVRVEGARALSYIEPAVRTNRVSLEFIAQPEAVKAFALALKGLLKGEGTEAVLIPA